jgi:hypothetical protein
VVDLLLTLALARAPKPKVYVFTTPGIGILRAPVSVTAYAVLTDPRQIASCPSWEISWGDGSTSASDASSCDPYGPDQPTEWHMYPKLHTYRLGGRFEITARVRARGKQYGASTAVTVFGPGGLQ